MDSGRNFNSPQKGINLFLLFGLFLLLGSMIIINFRTTQNNAPDSSGAIFGGRLEDGYPFAGYVISDLGDTLKICSAILISPAEAVTAAHCVDNDAPKFFGLGQYSSNQSDQIKVEKSIVHPDWKSLNKVENDLGLILLTRTIILPQYAEISKAFTGCDFVVVGYGKQDNSENFQPLRKSAGICIKDIDYLGNAISFNGSDGGLCFGDSGSGIFEEGTNKLVTIASSIDSCYIDNFGAGAKIYGKFDMNNFAISEATSDKINCGYIDVQNNKIIDNTDLQAFIGSYLETCSDSHLLDSSIQCGSKDINQDNVVDIEDLSKFAELYKAGKCF